MFKKTVNLFLVVLLLLTLSSFAAAQEDKPDISKLNNDLFSEALNDYNSNNFALAEEKFASLLNNEDLNEDLEFSVLYYSTMTAVKRNKTTEAIEYLDQFEKLGFQSAPLNWKIGKLFLNKNQQFDSADFNKALNYLEKANKLKIQKPEFKRDLAYAYLEDNQLTKAKDLYKNIVSENPTAADYINLAKINEKEGELNRAVTHYESALDLNSKESSLFLNLANLYQKLDNYEEAISIFKKGIELNKDFAPYYIGIGESYLKLDNLSEAKDALLKAVEINENSYYGYFMLGNIAREKGENSKALNYYSQSLKYNPNYVKAYLAEGKVHLKNEEFYRAISRFSLAVEKNPDYADSHYYLARAYYQADMLEAARSELRKTLHISDSYQEARDLLNRIEDELNID